VPRPGLQQEIKKQLQDTREDNEARTLVIYGLGGSGKSQLVLNYIREYRRHYAAVFWIEAGQKESIERDYIQIYRLLFGPVASEDESTKLEDAVTVVKNWFHQRREPTLLVFNGADTIDNVDDASYVDLTDFLPKGATVDTIITTRSSLAQQMTTLKVAEMEVGEAAALFCKYAKLNYEAGDIVDEVFKIVRELGCLALPVTLAGSYVATTPRLLVDLRQYLPQYHKHRKHLLGIKATKHIHQYAESVLTTWETSFAAVVQQSPMAARLLSLLAFLNFDDIFLDLFTASRDNATNVDRRWRSFVSPEVSFDRIDVELAFTVLQTYSLLQWRLDQGAYAMHKLVHVWSRDRLELDQQSALSVAALELLTDTLPTGSRDVAYGLRLVPHVMANFEALSIAYDSSDGPNEVVLNLIVMVADFLKGLGRWSEQHQIELFIFRKMCEIAGAEHPKTLTSMNNLAAVLRDQGKYQEAESMHRQALATRERLLGKEHPDTLTSMNNLAAVLRDQGKYQEAESMHRQALATRERLLGMEHPDTLRSISNLALVLRDQGRYEEAELMHRQVLVLEQVALGKEHPDTLTSMNNLAEVLRAQGKYEEAELMHRHVLVVGQMELGKEHPDTLTSMHNLAEVLRDQGKYQEAEVMYREALAMMWRVLGNEHPHTLMSMSNLARVLSNQGKYKQAENLHRQALAVQESLLGKEHPETLAIMNNLASLLGDQGLYEEAEVMHREALATRERMLGEEHPDTLTTMSDLAAAISAQGRSEEAEAILRHTLMLKERVLGKEHPSTLASTISLGELLISQGYEVESEKLLLYALTTQVGTQSVDSPNILRGIESLTLVLRSVTIDTDKRSGDYDVLLQIAAMRGSEELVRLLMEKGIRINFSEVECSKALQAAAENGHGVVVRLLLENAATTGTESNAVGQALQAASAGGHEAVVRLLLDRGADVSANLGYYGSALQAASAGGYETIVRLLLDRGADVSANLGYYGSALQAASAGGHETIVLLLLDRGADVNVNLGHYGSALQAASSGGYETIVRLLLDRGADVNAKLGHYGSALQAASAGGHETIVRLLLDRGADVNANLGHYGGALQAASAGGYETIVRLLLDKGADIHAKLGHYGSALQAASAGDHQGVIRLLIDKGVLLSSMSNYGPGGDDDDDDDAASSSSLTASTASLTSASARSSPLFPASSASSASSLENELPEAIFTILTGEVFLDLELKDICKKMLESKGEHLFIRIFKREIREFCSALRTENPTEIQKGAIRILRRYRAYFAFRVCRLLKLSTTQDGGQFEDLMQQIPAAEAGVEKYLQHLPHAGQPRQDATAAGSTREMNLGETTSSDSRNAGDHTRDRSHGNISRGSEFVDDTAADDQSNASDDSSDEPDSLPQSLTKDTISWLTRSSSFRNFKDYITRSISPPLQHVQEVLQPILCPSELCSATLHVDWELIGYTKSELEEGQLLSTVLTVSGGIIDAEASPCLEYCRRTWPVTGEFVVRALENAIRNGWHGKYNVLCLAIAS
jgi:ankyrin repeat protein/tetratricopeptide (TPR) repeat protein